MQIILLFLACSILKTKTFGHRLDLKLLLSDFYRWKGLPTRMQSLNPDMNSTSSDCCYLTLLAHLALTPYLNSSLTISYRIPYIVFQKRYSRIHTHEFPPKNVQ